MSYMIHLSCNCAVGVKIPALEDLSAGYIKCHKCGAKHWIKPDPWVAVDKKDEKDKIIEDLEAKVSTLIATIDDLQSKLNIIINDIKRY